MEQVRFNDNSGRTMLRESGVGSNEIAARYSKSTTKCFVGIATMMTSQYTLSGCSTASRQKALWRVRVPEQVPTSDI